MHFATSSYPPGHFLPPVLCLSCFFRPNFCFWALTLQSSTTLLTLPSPSLPALLPVLLDFSRPTVRAFFFFLARSCTFSSLSSGVAPPCLLAAFVVVLVGHAPKLLVPMHALCYVLGCARTSLLTVFPFLVVSFLVLLRMFMFSCSLVPCPMARTFCFGARFHVPRSYACTLPLFWLRPSPCSWALLLPAPISSCLIACPYSFILVAPNGKRFFVCMHFVLHSNALAPLLLCCGTPMSPWRP